MNGDTPTFIERFNQAVRSIVTLGLTTGFLYGFWADKISGEVFTKRLRRRDRLLVREPGRAHAGGRSADHHHEGRYRRRHAAEGGWRIEIMRSYTSILLASMLAITLTGCAALGGPPKPDTISFDARAFALTYGKLSQAVTAKCAAKQLTEPECARLAEIDAMVTKQILAPPTAPASGVDMEALMKFLMGAAKFAM